LRGLLRMKRIVGVIGASRCGKEIYNAAEEVGRLLARNDVLLITGGLTGVMEAASKGAYLEGGLTVGILPGYDKKDANPYVLVPLATGMGEARNALIARACDTLIAIGGEYGTLSEIALGLKMGKKVIGLLTWDIPGIIKVKTPQDAVNEALR